MKQYIIGLLFSLIQSTIFTSILYNTTFCIMDLTNLRLQKNLTQITIKTGLHIILTTDDDDSRLVYISGNFNNWLTQDRRFLMEKIGSGLYHFKFTRF
jgi:deoxyribodipyrimidine photolyase-like uncharacterized protein